MRIKMKSFLCLVLCLLMTLSVLSGFSMTASAATRSGAELLDTKTTSASKSYVLTAMDFYFAQNSDFANSTVVFLFEGASKAPAAYAFGGVRNQAIAVVVKNGAITYVEGNCSTIPDNPEKKYETSTSPSAPTVLDGVYKLVAKNHNGDYAAFNVQTTGNSGSLPCVRLDKSTKTYTGATVATAINLHTRGTGNAVGENADHPMSAGCLLAGLTSNFCTLVNKISGKSFSSGEKWSSSDLGKFCAYLVIDRQLAIQGLNGFVYGNYSGALTKITAASSSASGGASAASSLPLITLDDFGGAAYGRPHDVIGTVSSPTKITKVVGQFIDGDNAVQTVTITPNSTFVNLKETNIHAKLLFGKLPLGDYELKITATNTAGTISKSVYFKIDMVTIGNAVSNNDGKSGDSGGLEVMTQDWYVNTTRGLWVYVFRAKDPAAAEKIATAMEQACANDYIGYSNGTDRTTCYTQAKKVNWDISKITTKCDADCSALVSVCVNAAGISVSASMTTDNEKDKLMATGQFDIFTTKDYTDNVANLKRGDIIVRPKSSSNVVNGKKGGHTLVVLTNGCNVADDLIEDPIDDPIEDPPVVDGPVTDVVYYPACAASCTTIKSGLSNIGVDNTLNHRKLIAAANRSVEPLYQGYCGTAEQNTRMLEMLKQGILINPDDSECYPPCEDSYTGIAAALKSIGIDGSLAFRKTVAAANPSEPLFQGYCGTAEQNTRMLEMLKQGILRKP